MIERKRPLPTIDRLRELLDYEPLTGAFRWKVYRSHTALAGEIAGSRHSKGYWMLTIDNERVLAHVVAWAMSYGEWPTMEIDHENQVKTDNRLSNLRLATPSQNKQNEHQPRGKNVSGFRGVYWHKAGNGWAAKIYVDKKYRHLGLFATPEEASVAYLKAKKKFHEFWSDPEIGDNT